MKLLGKLSLFCFLLSTVSCATAKKLKPYFTPYRATIGVSSIAGEIKSDISGKEETICVSESPDIAKSKACSGGGFKSYQGNGYIDPWIEFKPNYFGDSSRFGWSYFLAYDSIKTSLVSYPNNGETTDLRVRKVSGNPYVYYNIGKKYLDKGGMSLRLGLGASLQYFWDFELRRNLTAEKFDDVNDFDLGFSAFIEFNWNWFILRLTHSNLDFGGQKFQGTSADTLKVQSNKISLLYSYYF